MRPPIVVTLHRHYPVTFRPASKAQFVVGDWSAEDLEKLIVIVAQRADDYEAALVGNDDF